MRILKTGFLLMAISVIAINPLTAQHIAVAGGMNMSNVRTDLNDDDSFGGRSRSTPGWHVGMIGDIPVKNQFSIETGAFFTTKGYRLKDEFEFFGITSEYRARLMTINFEVPVTLKYTWKLKGMDVYALAGPAFACGIYGNFRIITEVDDDVEKETSDVEWGSSDEDFIKRFDLGMKAGGGIRYNNFLAGISYTYGLLNISNNYSIHNRSFLLTVGYWFGSDTQ